VAEIRHDHRELDKRVLNVGALVRELRRDERQAGLRERVTRAVDELCDHMLLHLAREEEGLFPFVAAILPELRRTVRACVRAHDGLCGALLRMKRSVNVSAESSRAQLLAMSARFQTLYAMHSRREGALLEQIGTRLGPQHREELAALVRGL
jgi:hypothetical protein